jgi:hypothetical protein
VVVRSLLVALTLVCVAAIPAQAVSRKICWVDHVEKTSAGVNVYFMDVGRMFVNILITNRNIGYTLSGDGKIVERKPTGQAMALDHLALEIGDNVSLNAGPENGCQLTVVVTAAAVGLNANAWSGMSGPPATAQAFILATTSSR